MATVDCAGARRISDAIRTASASGRKALSAFLTAGYPTRKGFGPLLGTVADEVDLLEIGVPFSDPMADGVTIQETSEIALHNGTTMNDILSVVASTQTSTPLVLMSYLNPLLAFGFECLAEKSAKVGIAGFVIPDLPYEECEPFRRVLNQYGLALIQLVSPVSPPERLRKICRQAQGFVYAVTVTGVTGQHEADADLDYLDAVKASSTIPVLAGFGIRNARQFDAIARHADGAIVGSALLEVLSNGGDPIRFLKGLRRKKAGYST